MNDTAAAVSYVQIAIADAGSNKAQYVGVGADAYLVKQYTDTAADILNQLNDNAVTDFDDSGLSFGPADFTGGWRWKDRVIPAGKVSRRPP